MVQKNLKTITARVASLALLLALTLPSAAPLWSSRALASGETAEAAAEEPRAAAEKKAPKDELSATDILANAQVIAHGMGLAPGREAGGAPLNCLEGFEAQYAAGVRVFEADLRLTRDCKVVLRHDWWPTDWQEDVAWDKIPTREAFLSKPILDTYTPLSFQDLLRLMEKYPDICVITDTKFTDSDIFFLQFDAMMEDARELGLTYLFGRIAVQVYNGNMRDALQNTYHYPHYIYTLYTETFNCTDNAFEEKAVYCAERGIEAITMADTRWRDSFAPIADKYGIKVFVHTVNDKDAALKLLSGGVDAVYTDTLTSEILNADEDAPPSWIIR